MKRITTLFFLFLFLSSFFSDAQETELPESWFLNLNNTPDFISLAPLDAESIILEDQIADQDKNAPWRYGIVRELGVSSESRGTWTVLPDGGKLWQLVVHAPDAINLSFIFEQFYLPVGARFQIFNDDHTDVTNSFSALQYPGENRIGTWFVEGDTAWLEYYQPPGVRGYPVLQVASVIHGYRLGVLHSFLNPEGFNDSGACHHDINCPVGDDFDALKDELKKAVALLNLGNGFLCSAVLVNNTRGDKTPYLLTANHCLEGSDPDLWSVRFNWISPDPVCGKAEASGENNTNLTLSGVLLKARNDKSDFALVKLKRNIPESWDVVFAGWDNSDTEPQFEVGIHHPNGDIMKVCRDDSGAQKTTIDGKETWLIGGGSKGWGNGWEIGTTEKGSSGSPLFNESGKIIGQLSGGDAGCIGSNGNNQFDAYGRFGISWDSGTTETARLKDWLDPINTGQTSIETLQNILNVPDFATNAELKIYPNPATTTIHVVNYKYPHLQFELYTVVGQKLSSGKITDTLNEIEIRNLANGVYVLKLYDEGSQDGITQKIVIRK